MGSPGIGSIGGRVRSARLAAGLSQRELSVPGVSYAYISRIEAGVRAPSVKALRKIAPKLGVTVAWLETGAESLEVAGEMNTELVANLLALAHAAGIEGRPVRVLVEVTP